MGQPVAVELKPSATPGRIRLETNRSLTGMGHERYRSPADARSQKPADELARRLFAAGSVSAVHIYGNVVTIDLLDESGRDGVVRIVEDLYQYWRPGMQPPSEEELLAQVPKSAPTDAPAATQEGGVASPNAAKIPPHLLARSQGALAKARAKQG